MIGCSECYGHGIVCRRGGVSVWVVVRVGGISTPKERNEE